MKIPTKGMNQEGEGFNYLRQKCPSGRQSKIKEGIFVSQVKQQFQDPTSKIKLNASERRAWDTFENVCRHFLGNKNQKTTKK